MKRFLVGFILGAAVGATIVVLVAPKTGEELKKAARAKWNAALEEGRNVASTQEKELWEEFRKRINAPDNGTTDARPNATDDTER